MLHLYRSFGVRLRLSCPVCLCVVMFVFVLLTVFLGERVVCMYVWGWGVDVMIRWFSVMSERVFVGRYQSVC